VAVMSQPESKFTARLVPRSKAISLSKAKERVNRSGRLGKLVARLGVARLGVARLGVAILRVSTESSLY